MILRLTAMALLLSGCPWIEIEPGSEESPGPMDSGGSAIVEATVIPPRLEEVVLAKTVDVPLGFFEPSVQYEADLDAETVTRGVRRPATPTLGVDVGGDLRLTVLDLGGAVLLRSSAPNPLRPTTCEEDLQGPCDPVDLGFGPTIALRLPEALAQQAARLTVDVREGPRAGERLVFPLER